MKKIALVLALAVSTPAFTNDFVKISEGVSATTSFRLGSQRVIGQNYEVIASTRLKKEDRTQIEKLQISKTACEDGYGYVYYYELDGSYRYKNAFAAGSGTVGASEARYLCLWGQFAEKEAAN